MSRKYRYFSADSHYGSLPETWTHRVPANYRGRAPRRIKLADGRDAIVDEGQPLEYRGTNLFAGKGPEKFDPTRLDLDNSVGAGPPQQRIKEQDADGIDGELLFATEARNTKIKDREVYGSLGPEGYFTEETPYQPNSPYSASKAASDHLVRAYSHTYGLPVTVSNCSNNYGPYQFPEKLIPLMILHAAEGKPLPVYGQGLNVRDWLYVTDHCRAVWRIMQQGRRGEVYNIGGRCEMANIDTVQQICDLLDEILPDEGLRPRRRLITYVKDRPGHDLRYAIDCSKIEKELGWTPRESFATGFRKTIEWYLSNRPWVDRVRSGD